MKNYFYDLRGILIAVALVILAGQLIGGQAFGQSMVADKSPCEVIKGKSYLGWNAGVFDRNPDAVNSHKIVFDASGNGTSREFFVLNSSSNAEQIKRTVKCSVNASKISVLDFGSGGILYITSYDGGSRIWAESPTEGRKTKGWMLLIPSNPPAASNIIN